MLSITIKLIQIELKRKVYSIKARINQKAEDNKKEDIIEVLTKKLRQKINSLPEIVDKEGIFTDLGKLQGAYEVEISRYHEDEFEKSWFKRNINHIIGILSACIGALIGAIATIFAAIIT